MNNANKATSSNGYNTTSLAGNVSASCMSLLGFAALGRGNAGQSLLSAVAWERDNAEQDERES
jgi:hypothetical protein